MSFFDVILGPKCADCAIRLKREKFALPTGGWLCPACNRKRNEAEQRRAEDERRESEANARRIQGEALLVAARDGNVTNLKNLIAAGADVNIASRLGETPLVYAVDRCDAESVALLVAAGANANARDHQGEAVLTNAARVGDFGKVKALLAGGADVNVRNRADVTPLFYAAEKSAATETVVALIFAGADVNVKNDLDETPLLQAAWKGGAQTVIALLNAGADAKARNYKGVTALMEAAGAGDIESVNALLAAGLDVNAATRNGGTALSYATGWHTDAKEPKRLDVVKRLITAGADVNAENGYVIRSAASRGYAEIVEFLIANGAQVNSKNSDDETALMCAATNGQIECVRTLIASGADVHAKNGKGMTALQIAAERESEYGYDTLKQCIKILTTAGADPTWHDPFKAAAERARQEFERTKKLLPAKQTLSNSQSCRILYFRGAEERDVAFNILVTQFPILSHVERRNVTNRSVMYEHWIVTADYTVDMQRTIAAGGAPCPESQSVHYGLVLSDSDQCD